MTANVMNVWGELIGIGVGAAILLVFGWLVALMARRPQMPPGSRGFRPPEDTDQEETIEADGYIDSFAGVIEEAGGGLPPVVKAAAFAIPLWWLIYILVNWSPRLVSMVTFRVPTFR